MAGITMSILQNAVEGRSGRGPSDVSRLVLNAALLTRSPFDNAPSMEESTWICRPSITTIWTSSVPGNFSILTSVPVTTPSTLTGISER